MFDPSQLLEILFNNADKITFFLLQTKINDPLFFMERPIFANFAVVKSSARDMIVHRAICIIILSINIAKRQIVCVQVLARLSCYVLIELEIIN